MGGRQRCTLLILFLFRATEAFLPQGWIPTRRSVLYARDVIDADFERVPSDAEAKATSREGDDGDFFDFFRDTSNTLIDASLEMDPRWKDTRVPFIDAGDKVIECKLAFTMSLEGNMYGIGVPHDHPVLICVEKPNKDVEIVDPDNDDNIEIMEIMAGALQKYLSEDLKLRRTPRVLTVQGNLDNYTKNWQTDLFAGVGETVTADALLEDDDDVTIEGFIDLMKSVLGEESVEKTLSEDVDIDDEILKLFGVDVDEEEETKDPLAEAMGMDKEDMLKELKDIGLDPKNNGVGLKLCGFKFKDGKFYSVVKPFDQYTVVGKHVKHPNQIVFEMLTKDEEKILVPKLQEIGQKDLENAGLSLNNQNNSPKRP